MPSNSTVLEDDLNSFGPTIPSQFDLTPLFENSFLSILPSTILLFFMPFRLRWLYKQSRKVSKSILLDNKLAVLAIFTVFQAVVLILYATNSDFRTPTALAAASLVFADAFGLCFLSHAEHVRSVRPSLIINLYLFITLLFDIVRTRTLWAGNAPRPIAAVFTVATTMKLAVAIMEAVEKRSILLSRYQHSSPEVTSGIYSRSFFWWLNTLIRTGFQRVIRANDLFPIEDQMSSRVLKTAAQNSWNSTNKNRSHALFWSALKANCCQLAACILPRLFLTGFRYAQPFLLSRTVEFANSKTDSDNIGWGLTGAFGLVFLGMAVSSGSYYHMTYRFVTTVRGGLVSLIYAKTVELSIISLDESAAISLMSNDTETICMGFQTIHELWAVPIELGIALWLLQRQLGLAFLAPAGVAIISTICIIRITKYVGPAQKIWNQSIQTRIDVTASMLGAMKAVKILGFTDKLTDILQGLRVKELQIASLFRRLFCARVFFANSMRLLAPLIAFSLCVALQNSTGRELDTATAYTTLSLIALLANPINTLLRTIPMLNAALACFGRIQSFLDSQSRQHHVLPLNNSSNLNERPSFPKGGFSTDARGDIELEVLDMAPARRPHLTILDVRNATFAWGINTYPTVHDISFSVSRGSFTFVIGPFGCGKSTLLKGMVSETPSSKGFIYSDASGIAFVDQTPWVQNITIRENIVGKSSFDGGWYEQVVRACALDYDIDNLINRDATLVGSRGISLSGGQKQRLAMARAVYAKKELLIIDDGFSGLDAETEAKTFHRLFGKRGLLQQLGTTTILVTHAVHRLSYADHIIALDATGHVAEQGSFEYLKSSHGYVAELAAKHKYDNESAPNADSEVILPSAASRIGANEVNKSEAEENDITNTGELSTYKYYFASIGWSRSFISLFYLILSGVSVKLTELLLKFWTSALASGGNEVNSVYLGLYGILGGLAIIAYTVGVYHYFLYVVPGSAEVLHARLLKAVMGAPLHFFTSTDTGTTTNRFNQDMSVVDGELPFALIDLISSLVQTVMSAILMCISAGYFTLTIPVITLVVWMLQKYYLRTSRQIRILDLEAKSPLYSHFIESLSGLVTIRAFGWSEHFIEQNLALLENSQKPYYLLFCIQRWLALVLDLMISVLAMILMVLVVTLRDSIGSGFVGLALLNVMGFSESLAWNIKQWTALETSIGAIARLKSFAAETPNENLEGENQPVPDNWPAYGAVEFKNVSASYTISGIPIIKGINISIKPGEKIGICGRSGSGKSSLVMTLFHMLEIMPKGSIIVDGIDISTIPRQVVRSHFNAIPQDPFFMKGSIRLNASPSNLHTDTEIISALAKVQLWPIISSKGGLDANLDPEFFSQGQRQLFCLARAILRKSKIVVLDEVSSSIDVTTDVLVQRIVREEFAGATILSVAHRLGTILDFDRIALLSDGRLVEFDEPGVLLGRESGLRELYNS